MVNSYITFLRTHAFLLALCAALALLSFLSIYYLNPQPINDSPSYLAAMHYIRGDGPTPDSPFRLLTTIGGLSIIVFLAPLFGGLLPAWLAMNVVFYAVLGISFFYVLKYFFESERVALIGALLLAGNYAPIVFGLGYFMDMGGWAFYTLSLLFLYRYITYAHRRDVLWAAAMVGAGGLFKEYALLGVIPVGLYLCYESYPSVWACVKRSVLPALLATLPVAVVHLVVYLMFHYTYLDWISENQATYGAAYSSRIVEYGKALATLFNLLAPLVLLGVAYAYWYIRSGVLDTHRVVYVAVISASLVPAFLWPGITQRVLFICAPVAVLFACFFVKRFEGTWYWTIPFFVLYLLASFFMNSVLLPNINVPFL